MKKSSPGDYYLYLTAKTLSLAARFIPIELSIFIGRAFGLWASCLLIKKRNIAYKNLRIAFPNYSFGKINKITKQVFMNQAQHFVEMFCLPLIDEKYINRYIEFEGIEEVSSALKNKKGAIFLGLHEGSWEVASVVLGYSFKEYNYSILARAQPKIPLLDNLLNSYRQGKHCNVISIKDDLRLLVEHLKRGFALGMVADHGGQEGILVDFFDRPALTPTGAVKLALRLDTNLICGFIKRKSRASHKITLTVHKFIKSGDLEKDTKANLENINRRFEGHIKDSPSEYMWFFKRWKYSKQRNVLVLSDAKAGHLKQSLGVLDIIEGIFGVKSYLIEVKFKNFWQRLFFEILGLFFSNNQKLNQWLIKKFFSKNLADELLNNFYDTVISCGSSLAMLNLLISRYNLAKSIVIMKPAALSLKRFNLAIMPEHDKAPLFENVLSIKGGVSKNLDINKEYIKNIIDEYDLVETKNHFLDANKREFNANDREYSRKLALPVNSQVKNSREFALKPIIGLILGGDNKHLSLEIDTVKTIVDSLKQAVQQNNGTILVSTSRRTPKNIEEMIKKEFKDYTNCRMLIIANEFNPNGGMEAILYFSDILVVSGDSISMVSEAASAEKYTFVFNLKRKNPNFLSKYERFIESLTKDKIIYIADPQSLPKDINSIWQNKPPVKRISNNEIILERLKRIL